MTVRHRTESNEAKYNNGTHTILCLSFSFSFSLNKSSYQQTKNSMFCLTDSRATLFEHVSSFGFAVSNYSEYNKYSTCAGEELRIKNKLKV